MLAIKKIISPQIIRPSQTALIIIRVTMVPRIKTNGINISSPILDL
jgi:hypothetical protein